VGSQDAHPTHYYLSMGMDAVEIVLRTGLPFAITSSDDEAAAVRTVGDYYRVICSKLSLVPPRSPSGGPFAQLHSAWVGS